MGSWTDFDANYPPGKLTPATAFAVALGRLAGATSVYGWDGRTLAAYLPRHGIAYDQDVLTRAERYLRQVSDEEFLAEARQILNRRQKLCLALNVLERTLTREHAANGRFAGRMLETLGFSADELALHWQTLELKSDLSIFPQ